MKFRPGQFHVSLQLFAVAVCLSVALSALAAPTLHHEPREIRLEDPEASVQMLVWTEEADGHLRDRTPDAQFTLSNPGLGHIKTGLIRPATEGTGQLKIELNVDGQTLSAEVPVHVSGIQQPRAISFTHDIVPILSKYGCNAGGCHGKASGQNGFKLSLLGAEPRNDYQTLVSEARGRRIFMTSPEHSLLLLKSIGAVPHGGGKRFDRDSPAYRLMQRWISQGAPWGEKDERYVTGVEVHPAYRHMKSGDMQQLRLIARYSDGSERDVTAEAEYKSQQTDLLTVDDHGSTATLGRSGEATVMVRYMGQVDVARLTVPFGPALGNEAYAAFKPVNAIDELVMAKWKDLGIAPSPEADDATFIRRAYLDAVGILPTPQEVTDYLADTSADKRARLIDRILDHPAYADHWAYRWGDLLRNKRRYGDPYKHGTYAFAAWIRDAFARNMPYDQFVEAILTAQGSVSDNPAVVWYREVRNNVHLANDTAQLFLGTRVSCANCHNHPYEKMSQDDYWSFAAYFARLGKKDGEVSNEQVVFVRKDGQVNQPRTGTAMKMRGLLSPDPAIEYQRGEDPRQELVNWLRKKDNPYFATAMANRMWAHFMGIGLIDAVDDIRATNPPSNPALLEFLTADFHDHNFDIKHLIRRIMNARTYALGSNPTDTNRADHRNYARYYPRRLSAQVLADAVDSVTGMPTKYGGFPAGTRAVELPDESVHSDFLETFGRSQRETACACEASNDPSLPQVLHLMNNGNINDKIASDRGRLAEMLNKNTPDDQIVEELFLRVLGCRPTAEEKQDAIGRINQVAGDANDDQKKRQKRSNTEDLFWALLNTRAFVFNH